MMPGSRLAQLILACALSPDGREQVLGDLVEEYAVRRERTSQLAATAWCWRQVLRSVPWLLWSQVRRSGCVATIGVAAAACAGQAILELSAALVVPQILKQGGHGGDAVMLTMVLGSLVVVSWMANRIRPGAGTLLTLIVSAVIAARVLGSRAAGIHVAQILESVSAPSATLLGAALALNVRPPRPALFD